MRKNIYSYLVLSLMVFLGINLNAQVENRVSYDFEADTFYYVTSADTVLHTDGPGWQLNWKFNDNPQYGATVELADSELVVTAGNVGSPRKTDDGDPYASPYSVIITTPQVLLNIEEHPYIAFKFSQEPEFADTGLHSFRYQHIVRAVSNEDGFNHDWYGEIYADAIDDAAYCTHFDDDDCGGKVYLFELSKIPARWGADLVIPTGTGIVSDITLVFEGLKDSTSTAKLSWIKSFASTDDFYNFWYTKADICAAANDTTASSISPVAETSDFKAYATNGIIKILNLETGTSIQIASLSGAIVYKGKATSSEMYLEAKEGIYLVSSISQSGKISTVKVLNY